jgi:hypothetical protein
MGLYRYFYARLVERSLLRCSCVWFAVEGKGKGKGKGKGFRPLGELPFFARAKKGNPKKRFSTAEWLVKHAPVLAPFAALRVRCADGIF